MALPLLAAGLSVASAGYSWWNSRERSREMRAETNESVRRFQREADQRLGMARAAGAASGIEFESESLQRYLGEMSSEFRRQAEWMRRSGYRGAARTEQAGNFGLLTDLGASVMQLGQANNWWRPAGPAAGGR